MREIRESINKTYSAKEYQVAVVGGGIAGISAALAAARNGAESVILIEKEFMVGGLATLGLVTYYLPLCDGNGRQVSFGISEELLRLSIKYGAESPNWYPKAWLENGSEEEKKQQRFKTQFNPYVFAILCEELLLKAGVTILYGTSVCSVGRTGNIVDTLFLENSSGSTAIAVESVVDATGDAVVCRLAEEDTAIFTQGNVLAGWYQYLDQGKNCVKILSLEDYPEETPEQFRPDIRYYVGSDAEMLSEMVIDSHKMLFEDWLKKKEENPDSTLTAIPAIPQVRRTWRLNGRSVRDDDPSAHFEDSIGVIANFGKRGPAYEIPFSCLCGNRVVNLIAAGRCISVINKMWHTARVIPACSVTGEAAGTAAALGNDFSSLSVPQLQKVLKKNGVLISL